ncbi:MAG: SusD/RagB family nutrient-binding outer membrane lipoprotein [Janthinobacterium lividum]
MNIKIILKQKVGLALLLITILGAGCKKGTFDINNNPNTATSVDPKYTLSSTLTNTANLIYGGTANTTSNSPGGGSYTDVLNNWMGYWTQGGGYTPSTTYVLYQLNSSSYNSNWNFAYINLKNYNLLLTESGTTPSQANYRAISMIMTAFVYQRIVDLYNNAPYSQASTTNAQFSYKYDDASTIYQSCIAKLDSAVTIISANSSAATSPGNYDIMFKGDMTKWRKFAKTLKLKMLMRQTQGGIGSAAVKTALSSMTTADFLAAGEDAAINPGYSNASDAQENPFYYDVIANAVGSNGYNTLYFRANSYAANFYNNNNDPRVTCFYAPIASGKVVGRTYGATTADPNANISAIRGTGYTTTGVLKGSNQDAVILPAFESLFLQAEAIQRGYLGGTVATTYKSAVSESFRILGVTNYAAAAETYTSQANALTNLSNSSNALQTIITQKWAACNTYDPLESYSDWRRLGIPTDLPVSIYPGNTATHIPYRLPYPASEISYNSANVPSGGTANDILTSKIFWMP